ncbi:MAG: ScyD/ScyE family protein [Chloroflexota bacterium]
MRSILRVSIALSLFILTAGAVMAQPSTEPADPEEGCSYFEETSHNLCAEFEAYWEANGGLPVFGYPITEAEDEVNLDLDQTFLTQYFERERMELHPENAGTPYEVLLGRLGNEVLLMMGRNWHAFPKADPDSEHYFAETGHAIAPEFYEYWSSNGLDLGDDGVSFRESLALFGYPISPAEMETNTSGDTVLTQWFERARFEYHPDNPEGQQVLLGLLGNELLVDDEPEPPPSETAGEVIAEGLSGPLGVDATNGAVYVTEAGQGGDECVTIVFAGEEVEACYGPTSAVTEIVDGEQSQVVTGLTSIGGIEEATGANDVVVDAEGNFHIIMGLGADPAAREEIGDTNLGYLITVSPDGDVTQVADVAQHEADENPDEGVVDSNPYSLVMNDDGSYVVSDAGMNALVNVSAEGEVSTLATFDTRMVDAPDSLELPEGEQIPMESVPTGVVQGPDGAYYVGELTGFPFPDGAARVWRVTADGEAEVYAEGFTNVLDVAFDGAGNMYVLEMVAGGLLNANPEDPSTAVAQIIRVTPEGEQESVVSEGIVTATGMDIGMDGTIYVADMSLFPGMGRLQAISDIAEPFDGGGPDLDVVADGLNSPRDIEFGADGTMYVAEAGVGGDECFTGEGPEGETEICYGMTGQLTAVSEDETSAFASGIPSIAYGEEATGLHDIVIDDEGAMWGIMGLGGDPSTRDSFGDISGFMGYSVTIGADGTVEPLHDVAGYEVDANPDEGVVDSNPYSIVLDGEGGYVVSDAGMNALLHVNADGEISTLAVFETRMVDAPDFLELPEGEQIPMESVPTGVVQGPDGAYYVGELTGFPFPDGAAQVWRVTADGEAEVYAEGFTNVIDVAFDADGNMYVLEMLAGGLLNADPEDPATLAAQITMIDAEGEQTEIDSTGLAFATGMAIGPDGMIYVSNLGVVPGMGQVVRVDPAM